MKDICPYHTYDQQEALFAELEGVTILSEPTIQSSTLPRTGPGNRIPRMPSLPFADTFTRQTRIPKDLLQHIEAAEQNFVDFIDQDHLLAYYAANIYQINTNGSFKLACFEGLMSAIEDYAQIQPHHFPAIRTLFQIGGYTGLTEILDRADDYLQSLLYDDKVKKRRLVSNNFLTWTITRTQIVNEVSCAVQKLPVHSLHEYFTAAELIAPILHGNDYLYKDAAMDIDPNISFSDLLPDYLSQIEERMMNQKASTCPHRKNMR